MVKKIKHKEYINSGRSNDAPNQQKERAKNNLIHHEATDIDGKGLWLVRSLALRVCHTLGNG